MRAGSCVGCRCDVPWETGNMAGAGRDPIERFDVMCRDCTHRLDCLNNYAGMWELKYFKTSIVWVFAWVVDQNLTDRAKNEFLEICAAAQPDQSRIPRHYDYLF